MLDDTIVGIASAPPSAARGVVRLSGPRVAGCLSRCLVAPCDLADVRTARLLPCTLELPLPLGPLPVDLYYWPTVQSYTRQPAAELHLLGARPLLDAAVARLCACDARPARPGEFTMRAFLAGRLDLTQAEAVLGVIDAQDQKQLAVALKQLAGGLAQPLHQLRSDLLDLLAHVEAGLDFVEEDIQFVDAQTLADALAQATRQIARLADQLALRGGHNLPRVVLMGPPNAGKSSLFNALAGRARSLVTPLAGTTRDYLTAEVDLGGITVLLIDTAGTDCGEDPLAQATQATTDREIQQADARLVCRDATLATDPSPPSLPSPTDFLVLTKTDRLSDADRTALGSQLCTSSITGRGLDRLRDAVRDALMAEVRESVVVPSTAQRCRAALQQAASALDEARSLAAAGGAEELVAGEIRLALEAIGEIVGAVYTDDLLDRIFSRFCIGK